MFLLIISCLFYYISF